MLKLLKAITPKPLKRALRAFITPDPRERAGAGKTVTEYWTDHNVTFHHKFASAEESEAAFVFRNKNYLGYLEAMPVNKAGGTDFLGPAIIIISY